MVLFNIPAGDPAKRESRREPYKRRRLKGEKRYFYVYILASLTGTLYVGLTDDLALRLVQHRKGSYHSFTKRYRVNRLMYVEACGAAIAAAARETQIKKFRRQK